MFEELAKFKNINKIPEKSLEVVNFGTGFGFYDFCYEKCEKPAFNFSLLQQDICMDYQLLTEYAYLLANNCRVFLVLPFCIFCGTGMNSLKGVYDRYYRILPADKVEPYCRTPYTIWKKENPNARENWPEEIREEQVPLSGEEMERMTDEAVENWIRQLGILSFASGDMTKQMQEKIRESQGWLKGILAFCEEKGFLPTIVIPPMSRGLLEKNSMEFRESHFYEPLREVLSGKEIPVLDYCEEKRFCEPDRYFWPGFLVKESALAFTKDVLER